VPAEIGRCSRSTLSKQKRADRFRNAHDVELNSQSMLAQSQIDEIAFGSCGADATQSGESRGKAVLGRNKRCCINVDSESVSGLVSKCSWRKSAMTALLRRQPQQYARPQHYRQPQRSNLPEIGNNQKLTRCVFFLCEPIQDSRITPRVTFRNGSLRDGLQKASQHSTKLKTIGAFHC